MVGEPDVVSFGTRPSRGRSQDKCVAHPKDIGDRTQLAAMLALRDAGYVVLTPFGENTRYDVVIDDGKVLACVQCKTGRLRSGAVRFSVCSNYGHHLNPENVRRDYHGDVDFFAMYCPETQFVYLVPIDELPVRRQAALRVEPAQNMQRERIRSADDFAVTRVSIPTVGLAATAGAQAPSV